ncbi:hypothetical protein BKA70DRAFT_1409681 [Coprinopsis sp. MPI-PUGE-AT-0042]|nr:hypothetical protein BKA70DRAFT_1409681 [Coprinopsis sp. MPI-PUGE-AT-0042]
MSAETDFPPEILSEIFRQSLPNRLDRDGRIAFQSIRSVCSRWRSTALSSPVLWSSIYIMTASGDPLHYPPLLEAWFSRSGPSMPLELEYLDYTTSSMSSKDKESMKALIHRYRHRWRYLSLCIDSQCFWECVLSPQALSANWINLQALTLWIYDISILTPTQRSQALDSLAKLTSLERLLLEDHSSYKQTRPYGPVVLPELHISLDDVFATRHMVLIAGYPSLTSLTLIAEVSHELHLSARAHLTLPCLLKFSYTANDLALLRHITTPALVGLEIQMHSHTDGAHNGTFLSEFITRCTHTLQSMILCSKNDASDLTKILPALPPLPSLTRLTLEIWPFTKDNTFPEDVEKNWCPNLRHLTVSFRSGNYVEEEQMASLAASLKRRQGWGRMELETLTIQKAARAEEFPYHLFENVRLVTLLVMIPW